MKPGLLHLAQAFVDTAEKLSATDLAHLTDVTIAKLKRERLGSSREFFRAVSIALRQKQHLFRVESATPLSKDRETSLTTAAKKSTSLPLHTVMADNTALMGGVVVQLGDERFDASALGMLHRASEALLAPLH